MIVKILNKISNHVSIDINIFYIFVFILHTNAHMNKDMIHIHINKDIKYAIKEIVEDLQKNGSTKNKRRLIILTYIKL